MRYLDSKLEWNEPEVGSTSHSIKYSSDLESHKWGDNNPISAKAGDTVTVEFIHKYLIDTGKTAYYAGWVLDDSSEDPGIVNEDILNNRSRSFGVTNDFVYVFTMPDSDIWVTTAKHSTVAELD